MKKNYTSLFFIFFFTIFIVPSVKAQCTTNILTNPGFDAPIQPSIGNNLLGVFTFNGWTMTGGPFNVIRTNGSNYSGGPNNARNGTQYVDITSAGGTIHQDFTITGSAAPIAFGGYFSSRESTGYINWTASIQILSLPSNTVVATSNTRNFVLADGGAGAQEIWHYINGNRTLSAGSYRYLVNLGNYGNFDGAFLFLNCTLPVQLSAFTSNFQNNTVQLNWKVELQSDFSHFEVERSYDGASFSVIKRINSTGAKDYQFIDDSFEQGSNIFYRLKMVDQNGSFKYSNILKMQTKGIVRLSVMPNPAARFLTVSGLNRTGQIEVFDMQGKRVIQNTVQSQALSIDLSNLQSGMYLLKYNNGTNTEIQKFFKQ